MGCNFRLVPDPSLSAATPAHQTAVPCASARRCVQRPQHRAHCAHTDTVDFMVHVSDHRPGHTAPQGLAMPAGLASARAVNKTNAQWQDTTASAGNGADAESTGRITGNSAPAPPLPHRRPVPAAPCVHRDSMLRSRHIRCQLALQCSPALNGWSPSRLNLKQLLHTRSTSLCTPAKACELGLSEFPSEPRMHHGGSRKTPSHGCQAECG
eukprot:366082-Chlamydomonas_euryale.AAC.2